MTGRTWLFPDGVDRERMLDMDQRLQPVRRRAFGVLAIALLAGGPWIGWWTVLPLALAAFVFKAADRYVHSSPRPEYAMFGAWAFSEVIIAISVALTGGPNVATMSWLAIPIVTLTARFSGRGVVLGVLFTLGLLLAVGFGVDAAAVIDNPTVITAPASLIVAVAMLSTALMHSDIEHRNEAVLDQLTGMLNRKALRTRVAELAQQSRLTRQPVAVVVGDLDAFKKINDKHGHAAGDAVLKDVAYLLRKELRAFDLVYRLGGEEFVIVLPGAGLDRAADLAEQLRRTVAAADVGPGLRVTMSFGVSGSRSEEVFDYDAIFAEADAALYGAKSAGRDRVHVPRRRLQLVAA
jgi:diguanylate cyclase (GGDEF)-like protein